MTEIIKDWTKQIVPKVSKNNYPNDRIVDRSKINFLENLSTTDFIRIPSTVDMNGRGVYSCIKTPSDFALLNGVWQGDRYPSSTYYLSTASSSASVYEINFNGLCGTTSVFPSMSGRGGRTGMGLVPRLTLKLPKNMPARWAQQELGKIDKMDFDGKQYYVVYLGEYPQTKVYKDLKQELEDCFDHGRLRDGITPTGRYYTSNGIGSPGMYKEVFNFSTKLNPEFMYKGKKFVRTIVTTGYDNRYSTGRDIDTKRGSAEWTRVEPIAFLVINSEDFELGKTDELELEALHVLTGTIPFYPDVYEPNCAYWQNSPVRAFLNSARSQDQDGNPTVNSFMQWNFTNRGFLSEAFDMTRAPMEEFRIPDNETLLSSFAFNGCVGLKKIIIPNSITDIGDFPFIDCPDVQIVLEDPNPALDATVCRSELLKTGAGFRTIYISKDGNDVIFSGKPDPKLDTAYCRVDYNNQNRFKSEQVIDKNFRKNYVKVLELLDSGKLKFMPPDYTLTTFPSSEFEKYLVNNNNQRWGKLVKTLGLDTLDDFEKENSLTDLLKIYYAIGGFSENQGESERAMDYILKYVAVNRRGGDATPLKIGEEIHRRFSGLVLKGPYNPTFANFFMKYYKDDPNFMRFEFPDRLSPLTGPQNYLCSAHNNFDIILKNYPNRVVNGNEERSLLTPKFVAEHCIDIELKNVDEGNELLAEMSGKYGLTQEQFEQIQKVFNKAKDIKDKSLISAESAKGEKGITFRVLEKDDPLGFFLGDLTNCCQHVSGAAESCVYDGYLNPNAGFIVFEQSVFDKNGNFADEKRILGQAYIWYDPKTKTVCYDNIEIPTKVLEELRKGEKRGDNLSSTNLLNAVVESADAIMTAMNNRGISVERVTTGEGYNDLVRDIRQRFGKPEKPPKSMHRNYNGYSDANSAQYVIRNYDETTRYCADSAIAKAGAIQNDIADMQNLLTTQNPTENERQSE